MDIERFQQNRVSSNEHGGGLDLGRSKPENHDKGRFEPKEVQTLGMSRPKEVWTLR